MGTSTAKEALAPAAPPSKYRRFARFLLHVLAVYAITNTTTMWLAGFAYGRLLPLLQQHPPSVSRFQFAFSHLFIFSFYPALAVGFIYAHWYRHKAAYLVWTVPFVILAYKFLTFPASTSVLEGSSRFATAFHQYFAGGFVISEFRSWEEMFQIIVSSAEMTRGMAQYHFTAPFYAGIGYGIGTLFGIKLLTPRLHSVLESIKPSLSPRKIIG